MLEPEPHLPPSPPAKRLQCQLWKIGPLPSWQNAHPNPEEAQIGGRAVPIAPCFRRTRGICRYRSSLQGTAEE